MKITVLYVGASLLASLRRAEADINRRYSLALEVAAHNCGSSLSEDQWQEAENDIIGSQVVFIIHVTDEENAVRIVRLLDETGDSCHAIIAINCMPMLMRLTRMGRLNFSTLMKQKPGVDGISARESSGHNLTRKLASWMADYFKGRKTADGSDANGHSKNSKGARKSGQYVKLIGKLPAILKLVPATGKIGDVKHYLNIFCYFLQPTPRNIRSMLLYSIKHYLPDGARIKRIEGLEKMPAVGIYHPDAEGLFETFEDYRRWYERARQVRLDPTRTIGLLLMRPQIISGACRHYDALIGAIESEGLAVIPAISTFLDNREACEKFFVDGSSDVNRASRCETRRVSQIVSLTGFSFVGGPAMNDSHAATEFLGHLGVPFRTMVSLDFQTLDNWHESRIGLNPVQTAMQVAIPEIDGATEPFIFGGVSKSSDQPEPLEDRCKRIARRLARWNRLREVPREEQRMAFIVFCFPPNKGNIGTAADLDVFESLIEVLNRLKQEGYKVTVPPDGDSLRDALLGGNSAESGTLANVRYRMDVGDYLRFCPYVRDVEEEWGAAPGSINSNGRQLLILGADFGNVFIGIQPTFGYEGDPMRMLNSRSGSPHHGFMALYAFLEKVYRADAVIHVGTHGSLEFMPGKQVGLSNSCWPDRLIGELPNIYLYSVNNPSEGTIAKRRSYAELVSYLTPPIENAGLYKELASMKELLTAYRQSSHDSEREALFEVIEEKARELHL